MCCLRMLHESLSKKRHFHPKRDLRRHQQRIVRRVRKMRQRMSRKYSQTGGVGKKKKKKKWYDYLWVVSLTYLILGFFNILFAWLGLLCFFIPLLIAMIKGNKAYCNKYCGRGQLFALVGGRFGFSRKKDIPKWMRSAFFRYGFLIFFFVMFFLMLWNTYLVFAGGKDLSAVVTLLWTFQLPWHWAYHGTLFSDGVAQFAFGFYSVMLTSTVLGFVTMLLFKPRSWCVYCPMGTMTQLICKAEHAGSSAKR